MYKLIFKNKNFFLNTSNVIHFSLFLVITFVLSIDLAANLKLGWDSQFRWIVKALNFYQGNSLENLINFSGPEYPHFGSYLWSYFWKISYLDYEYTGRIFYIALFSISIFSFCEIFDTNKFISSMISIIIILIGYKYLFFNGYQDIIIFCFLLFVSKSLYLILYKNNQHKIHYALMIVNLILVSWIKTEGFLYALFILMILILLDKNKNVKLLFSLVFIFLILSKLLTYQIFDFPISLQGETYSKPILDFNYTILIDRFLLVVKFYMIFLFNNLLMLFSILALIYLIFSNFKVKIVKFLTLFFILNASFILGSHLFMNIGNIDYWITHTIPRFMLQTTGIYIISIVLIYNINLKKKNK